MIELKNDELVFSFPEVHKKAVMRINFQRTLRIPDDGREHYLPPGLGKFPLGHVDDFENTIPESWVEHGGVMLPMYQSEAMWLDFSSPKGYPFVVKIATGKINAVSGILKAHGNATVSARISSSAAPPTSTASLKPSTLPPVFTA